MSPENKEQLHALLDGIYANMLTDISAGRNLSVEELKKIANDYAGRDASRALAAKLVDGLRYKDEVLDELRSKLGIDAKDDIKTITANDYFKAATFDKKKGKNKIAVVYCEGSIGDGDSDDNGAIAGERYARMLRKIRQDDKVKAVVLRVNSPGGSAQASDCIWREVERLKQAGIPVVTSMGDVAASGGYYIACNSNKIFAEPNCITGSIGVFGIIPNMRQLYNNTLAITADTVRTAKFAAFNPLYFDMTPEESQLIQGGVDSIYHTFKSRVSKGRNLDMAKVEEIAQGRVWLAPKAKEIGLVDELGSLRDAIDYVANQAGISSDYKTVTYPEIENGIEKQLKKFGVNSQATVQAQMQPLMQEEMGMFYKYYDMLRAIGKMKGIQMRLPYNLDVK
jgi:protease-4